MTHKISYSSIETFEQCSEKWRLKYQEKLVSSRINSPLFFGSALDEAFSYLLLRKKTELTENELTLLTTKTVYDVFDQFMKNQEGKDLATNPDVEYSANDFDPDFLKAEDLKNLKKFDSEITDHYSFYEECRESVKAKKKLSSQDQKLFNYMNWLSLYNKGLMLIQAYEKEVLPKIKEVFDIQKQVHLENSSGDVIRGKIDFIASFVDDPDTKVICDNKTASKAYLEDSVAKSMQLSIYCESEELEKAAYVVVEKQVRKKEPKVRINIIKDTVMEESFESAFQKVDSALQLIHSNAFEKKADKKECWFFGKKCEYFGVCWFNDFTGITRKEK